MAQRHSHAYHDGMERGRELKGRGGILKSASGSARLANQVCENYQFTFLEVCWHLIN